MQVWLGIDIGIRNISCCALQKDADGGWAITRWELHDLLNYTGDQYASCQDLNCVDLHAVLDHALPLLFPRDWVVHNVQHVCIEQQPHGRCGNPKLVLLAHLLYDYFYALLRHSRFGETLLSVAFVSPNSKYNQAWLDQYGQIRQKRHGDRKRLSIYLTENLVRDLGVRNQSGTVFEAHQKRDDLADSFLLALFAALSPFRK